MKQRQEPLYMNLYKDIENQIKSGKLLPGDKLPPKRALAAEKNVSVNTVIAAYDLAVKNGLVQTAERIGYFAAGENDKRTYKGSLWSNPDSRKYVFSINANGITTITKKFIKARRDAEYDIENRLLSSKEYTGNNILRERICEYLYKTRRITCNSEQVILSSGLSETMSICSRLIGSKAVYAFENPTEKKLLFSLIDSREAVPIPADANGFDRDALYTSGADVFFCMPEKQYPIGYKLSVSQREDILNWCGDTKYIIEYGLCCDFDFNGSSKPLYELDNNGRVIYINSFDKVTVPGMTLSYMILPEKLVGIFKEKLWYHHSNVSEYDSLVLSEFINNGGIYSNIKRLKKLYEKKKNIAIEEFKQLPFAHKLSFTGTDNGYFFGVAVNTDKKGYELMARNSLRDVKLLPVSCYNFEHDNSATMFAFGYSGISEADLKKGIRIIGEAWSETLLS